MVAKKYLPSDDIRHFVKSYFVQEIDIGTHDLVIPALTQTFVQFHYGQLFTMLHSTGQRVRFFPVTLTGIMTTFSFFAEENPKPRFVAVELHPYVPFLLFKERNRLLVNSSFDGADLLSRSEEVRQSLSANLDPATKVDLANQYFESLFASTPRFDDDEIIHALQVMDAPADYAQVETRLNRLAENPRHFRLKFKRAIGVSPKLFMRIRRMEKVLSDMHTHPDARYMQKTHGFYDQPHFIRECKLFTGRTPTAIFAPFKDESVRDIHNNLS